VDALAFDAALAEGSLPALQQAVALYRGPLLEGWTEEWVLLEREARAQAYLAALETLATQASSDHDPAAAVRYLRLIIAADPFREAAHGSLMQALADCGDYAAVIQVYRDLRLLLHRELNTAPAPETEALYKQLQARAPLSVLQSPAPVRGPSLPPRRLPVPLTRLIGREREVEAVVGCLGQARLVTLIGTGGVGKTRLAIAIAERLAKEYAHGVWFVELASLSDPGLVVQTVAKTLGVEDKPGRGLQEVLVEALGSRSLLLVLDNCEHLVEVCASLAESLLSACPQVQILATSRERLNVEGEHVWRVPSLMSPDPKALPVAEKDLSAVVMEYDAARLFVERATTQQAEFRLSGGNAVSVAAVCHRLDGIPLALELAAARVRVLSVDEIAAHLDDRFRLLVGGSRTAPSRQQTLRALLDWSYELLNAQERILLHRLSVFAGGWRLRAAEAICSGEGIEDREVLDLLTSLVDKSLVFVEEREGETRYRLLETVRQYAWERLEATGEAMVVRNRHLDFCLALAEEVEPYLHGPEQRTWLQSIESEHDNLRAALDWSQMQAELRHKGLRLAGALAWFWHLHNYLSEGRNRLEGLLGSLPPETTPVRAKALQGAGRLAFYLSDYTAARSLLEQSITLWRELEDKQGVASALGYFAASFVLLGDAPEKARPLLEESVVLAREAGDRWVLATSLWIFGFVIQRGGDNRTAGPLFEESITLYREVGDLWGITAPLNYLGEVRQSQGDYTAAYALVEEGLDLVRQIGDKWRIAVFADTLGEIALAEGDYGRARPLFEESLQIVREAGNNRRIAYELKNLGHTARLVGELQAARLHYQESLALYQGLNATPGIANLLDSLARLASAEGQTRRATQLFGASEALRETVQTPVPDHERADYERNVGIARATLGEEAFAAIWAEGRAMTVAQAIAYALQEPEPGRQSQ
jgi:non-specific serine/threonine protein kinase